MTVTATRTGVGRTVSSRRTGREQLDALVGHDAGRQDLAGELGQPVQLADVVDGADQADDRGAHEDARDLAAAVDALR